ncbi:histidine phosphatase family protein [Pseudoxanthomonas sp. SL93]|uniref:histidine phosphatase family protein n=1 Tax=Pseudoxanthomonas sp. SL93 TaxID=2995142 RepID=UPI00226FB7D8|nr:histidine phosphatase family protein [Pseudoxanthomonas sp. SL93]WAC64538.1 histidine phosphatase family protein [Pseudoxanthomonas sp. SL93]
MHPIPYRKLLPVAMLLLSMLFAAGCATTPPPDDGGVLFIVVRHAEKAKDDPDNPSLSAAGQARAAALAQRLADQPLRAVYATEFRRTQQTAQPTASAHGLPVSAYYAKGAASETAARWKQQHVRGAVLVVGHSNTVPDLVAALCACNVAPMDDTEYDRLSLVRINAQGEATLDVQTYGSGPP